MTIFNFLKSYTTEVITKIETSCLFPRYTYVLKQTNGKNCVNRDVVPTLLQRIREYTALALQPLSCDLVPILSLLLDQRSHLRFTFRVVTHHPIIQSWFNTIPCMVGIKSLNINLKIKFCILKNAFCG